MTPLTDAQPRPARLPRILLVLALTLAILAVAAMVGVRYALLLLVGLGLGMTLEGLRFGFAGPWRAVIERRDPRGLIAQLFAIGLAAIVAFPLLSGSGGEIIGAHAPIGFAMVGGAFVFGAAMMIVLGCGSGTLVNAGSGNAIGSLALIFFIFGSFAGSYHLDWWTGLGSLPLLTATESFGLYGGLLTTLGLLALVAIFALRLASPENRQLPRRLWLAAILVAALGSLNLVIAGQPWGVVYGLGLWGAKTAQSLGADLSSSAFWASPTNVERLSESILTDVTSLTNIGLITGAFVIAFWRKGLDQKVDRQPLAVWAAVVVAGFLLGYSARLAFGCNVGAFFSGISTGSFHGWAWFASAFIGAYFGLKLRPLLGFDGARQQPQGAKA